VFRESVRVLFLLVLLVPTISSAASLDDYYLSHLAPQYYNSAVSALVVAQPIKPTRSLTGIRHSVKRDWSKLEKSTQQILAKVLARPALTGERTCTPVGGHFTIHYATSGSDAPDLTDNNHNNVPDWVETVAGVFEYVYDVEVNKMAYRSPPAIPYHVYLESLASQRAYGFTTDDGIPTAPSVSASSYIEIDKGYTDSIFLGFTPEESLRVTAAHEFHHAIQYGYNYFFDIFYAEMTSTWMEDEVYDSVNQLYEYLPYYLGVTSTLALNAPIDQGSEYARWIFNRYLAELQGSRTVVRAYWERLGTLSRPQDGSDIDGAQTLDAVLNGNLGNVFFGFAKRVYLRDWTSHLSDVNRIVPAVTPAQTFSVSGTVQAPINVLSTSYTFAYYKYVPSSVTGQDLTISFPSLAANYAVAAFKSDTSGVHEYQYSANAHSILVPSFTSDAVVYLLVCNNGGSMLAPYVGAFPADNSTTLDGSALDANALVIPAQDPIPTSVTTTSSSSSGGKSGCFIATAAYGSYLHPKVALLREFRDRHLLTNAPGRLFVKLYYAVSPPIADLIARHAVLRGATRLMLAPVIFAVEHGAVALVLLLTGMAALVAGRLKMVRSRQEA